MRKLELARSTQNCSFNVVIHFIFISGLSQALIYGLGITTSIFLGGGGGKRQFLFSGQYIRQIAKNLPLTTAVCNPKQKFRQKYLYLVTSVFRIILN